MALIDPALGVKLVFYLGITNLIGLGLVFFTCRCMMGPKLTNWLWQYEKYRKFYNLHCYFWMLFFASVFVHALVAISTYGVPS